MERGRARKTLEHVDADLDVIPALALCLSSALYLLSYVAIRWRVSRTLSRGRSAASVGFAALAPVAVAVPAIVTLALVTAIWVALHAYELIWWREERAQRRAAEVAEA